MSRIHAMIVLLFAATVIAIQALHPLNLDEVKTIHAPQGAELPDVVDLSLDPRMPPPYNQEKLGSCTANALAGAYQFVHKTTWTPSRLMLYYGERELDGDIPKDKGSSLHSGIAVMEQCGVAPESMWPYIGYKCFPSKEWWLCGTRWFTLDPPRKVWEEAKRHRVGRAFKIECNPKHNKIVMDKPVRDPQADSAAENTLRWVLAQGSPIAFSIPIYANFSENVPDPTPYNEAKTMPDKLNSVRLGGHAMLLVGYDVSTKRFKFRNSWGLDWGNNGYGTISLEYLVDHANEMWVIDPSDGVASAAV